MWIPELHLSSHERAILESRKWLNDRIISAAQNLLFRQANGTIVGFQSTLCRNGMFKAIPSSQFIQILFSANSHWLTVTNMISGTSEYFSDTVRIYDSGRPRRISMSVKSSICSFMRPKSSLLCFDVMDVDGQLNSYDCGVYVIAYATHLVYGLDPVLYNWDSKNLRAHLLTSFVNGMFQPFPTYGTRNRKSLKCLHSESETVHCTCRMINYPKGPMLNCDGCKEWFHNDCINNNTTTADIWYCPKCDVMCDL